MSKKRRRSKRDRIPNVQRSPGPLPLRPDLLDILRGQVAFLIASAKAYDVGDEREAVRLAATLRVLMHQTSRSHSLLAQVGLRERMLYFDTALPYSSRNLLPETALTSQRLTVGKQRMHGRFLPHLDARPVSDRWTGVRRWWELNPIIRDSCGELFTRRDLVLYAANEDGGAHVQPALTPRYEALTRQNSLGFQLEERGVSFAVSQDDPTAREAGFDWDNGPALPSVRMIAHEMLVSLQRAAPDAMGGVIVRERASTPSDPSSIWLGIVSPDDAATARAEIDDSPSS